MALTKVTADVITDASITIDKVHTQFKTAATIAQGGGDLNFESAQVFTLTSPTNSPTTTINITNPIIGVQKTLIVLGSGSTIDIGFTVDGASGTFNKISGNYDDTVNVKNLYSILCVGATEFWYSISQIAT